MIGENNWGKQGRKAKNKKRGLRIVNDFKSDPDLAF
jgi:hypothetical protein